LTTIAYKDGVIAYDSRSCKPGSGLINSDDVEKRLSVRGKEFFLSGPTSDFVDFVAAYEDGRRIPYKCDVVALVWTGEVLQECMAGEEGEQAALIDVVPFDRPFATGSGSRFAYTAMDMGANAVEAVKMAAKRDMYTGGKVRVFKIPGVAK